MSEPSATIHPMKSNLGAEGRRFESFRPDQKRDPSGSFFWVGNGGRIRTFDRDGAPQGEGLGRTAFTPGPRSGSPGPASPRAVRQGSNPFAPTIRISNLRSLLTTWEALFVSLFYSRSTRQPRKAGFSPSLLSLSCLRKENGAAQAAPSAKSGQRNSDQQPCIRGPPEPREGPCHQCSRGPSSGHSEPQGSKTPTEGSAFGPSLDASLGTDLRAIDLQETQRIRGSWALRGLPSFCLSSHPWMAAGG